MLTVERFHDFSYGHRVFGHESCCSHLHGHNGRVTFTITAPELDDVGRVLDFSAIKTFLCMWLENNWDHRFLVCENDPWAPQLALIDHSVVWTPFNPTAENLAKYLVEVVAPVQLAGTGCTLIACCFEETRKCSAVYTKD